MRRRDNSRLVAIALFGVIVLLLVGLLLAILFSRGAGNEEALAALSSAEEARVEETVVDPWAGRGDEAISRVSDQQVGGMTVGRFVESSLASEVELYQQLPHSEGEWRARRVPNRSLYWVRWATDVYGVTVGPRWLVQLDEDGPKPEGSTGVIAANALAEFAGTAAGRRAQFQMNRSDEVLIALTNHRFDGGVRLGSALLTWFAGRERRSSDLELLGWVIVPERLIGGNSAVYHASFQWSEAGRVRVAQWEVNVSNSEFKAINLMASEVTAAGASVAADRVVDIRPQSMRDLTTLPSRESNPMRRALRYVLADERLSEAVGVLLAERSEGGEIEYTGWNINPDGCTTCNVEYRYTEGGEARSVTWTVTPNGELEPTCEISAVARRVLNPGLATPEADAQ